MIIPGALLLSESYVVEIRGRPERPLTTGERERIDRELDTLAVRLQSLLPQGAQARVEPQPFSV